MSYQLCTETDDILLPPSAFLISLSGDGPMKTTLPGKGSFSTVERCILENQTDLDTLKQENAALRCTVNQVNRRLEAMKAYIGESPNHFDQGSLQPGGQAGQSNGTPPSDSSHATESLEFKLNELKQTNKHLERELSLSTIRVKSLESILALQEKKLGSFETDKGGTSVLQDNGAPGQQLLAYWRSQVLRLLFCAEQEKSSRAADEGRHRRLMEELQSALQRGDDATKTVQLKLQSAEAALATERGRVEGLQARLQESNKRELNAVARAEQQHQRTSQILSQLHTSVARLSGNVQHFTCGTSTEVKYAYSMRNSYADKGTLPTALRRLGQLERRVSFAVNRLPPLRAKLVEASASRVQQPRRTVDGAAQTSTNPPGLQPSAFPSSYAELEDLLHYTQLEVERTREERDDLLRKYEEYVKTFNARTEHIQDEVKAEVVHLREKVRALEATVTKKQQEVDSCCSQLDELKADRIRSETDASSERTALQDQLKETQKQLSRANKAVAHAQCQIEHELDERKRQMTEMEANYQARIRSLEQALRTYNPETYVWYPGKDLPHSDLKVETTTLARERPASQHLSPAQLDSVALSLSNLVRMTACLRESSDSIATTDDENSGRSAS